MVQLILGLTVSSGIGWLAYQRHSLSQSGIIGAVLTGTLTVMAGWAWAAGLLAFFLSSSLLSKLGESRKATARAQFSRGEQRDFWQVMANGAVAALIALLYLVTDEPKLWVLYLGALAAVNADTWATEIGTLSRQAPRSFLTLKPVQRGISGGVTVVGTLGSLGGAFFIALVGVVLGENRTDWGEPALLGVVTLAGFAGSLVDSLLGATVQAMYWCADKETFTEKNVCASGQPAELRRGVRWINNDVVNLCAGVVGIGVVISLVTL